MATEGYESATKGLRDRYEMAAKRLRNWYLREIYERATNDKRKHRGDGYSIIVVF